MSTAGKLLISGALLAVGVAVVTGTVMAARFYFGGSDQRSAQSVCLDNSGHERRVAIRDGVVTPAAIMAWRCDRLVITNYDDAKRRLAFGEHDHHVDYDGADGRLLGKDQTLTIVLSEPGEFMFHDHFDEAVHGHFTVQ